MSAGWPEGVACFLFYPLHDVYFIHLIPFALFREPHDRLRPSVHSVLVHFSTQKLYSIWELMLVTLAGCTNWIELQ